MTYDDKQAPFVDPLTPVAEVLRSKGIRMYAMATYLHRICWSLFVGDDRRRHDYNLRVGDLAGKTYEELFSNCENIGHVTLHHLVNAGLIPPLDPNGYLAGALPPGLPEPPPPPGPPEALLVKGKHKLACPRCGAKGLDNFQWLEDITSYRELISLKDGVLLMRSHYDVYDENGTLPRLLCKKCDQECLVPDSVELDWE